MERVIVYYPGDVSARQIRKEKKRKKQRRQWKVYGNMKHEIWNMKHKTWNMKYETWNVKHEIWNMKHEIWNMKHEIWNMKYEIWNMKHEIWKGDEKRKNIVSVLTRGWPELEFKPTTFRPLVHDRILITACSWKQAELNISQVKDLARGLPLVVPVNSYSQCDGFKRAWPAKQTYDHNTRHKRETI